METEKKTPPRRTLGRGLGALLGEAAVASAAPATAPAPTAPTRPAMTVVKNEATAETAPPAIPSAKGGSTSLAVAQIQPGPFQPRRIFSEEALAELASSIAEKGVLQPILVRPHPAEKNSYQIIGGERRWRAAQQAGLTEMPVVVRNFTDAEAMEAAIIENVQRQDLTPMEEAEGFHRLLNEFGHTHDDLSRVLGKSRAHISNAVRLLKLPKKAREALDSGDISAGHARVLLTVDDPQALLMRILAENLSVRMAEDLAREGAPIALRRTRNTAPKTKNPNVLALEKEMVQLTGLKTVVNGAGQSGTITFKYKTLDQLDALVAKLRG